MFHVIPTMALAFCALAGGAGPASAQSPGNPGGRETAAVVVEGTVREIFRSPRQNRADFLVEIEVTRSELGRLSAEVRRGTIPAPGDPVYVHIVQGASSESKQPGRADLPAEQSRIRAYLSPRQEGGWQGAGGDWYETTAGATSGQGRNNPPPPATPGENNAPSSSPSRERGILSRLGIRAEQVRASGRLVLKIIDVLPNTPAQRAGLEPGDAIIGINGGFITDLDRLSETLTRGGPIATLAVLNVRNGETASVKIDVGPMAESPAPQQRPDASPATTPRRTLGVKTETVRSQLRKALRVTEVEPGSVAEMAGIEKGDVIVEANGVATEDVQQLEAAVQQSGATLTLKVSDSRTGRIVPVEVHLESSRKPRGPTTAPIPSPETAPAPTGGAVTSRSLGIMAEAGTADLLPVVKVVRVESGSPAERAGIEPGDAIVGLNDKVIFAPDLLDEALKSAGSSFTLTILDVKTGKKTPVKVSLR
jgi:S1-C subfamily serine protease